MTTTPVLIAGGGPVGLMLAHELEHHGIDAILIERNETTTRHPKMDITNARSMEIFRRLDLVEAFRDVAVSDDHPVSVIWVSNLPGVELARFDYPSVQEQRETLKNTNDGTGALEPSMRVSQVLLEPVFKESLEKNSKHIDLRFGWGLETYTQDEDGVTAIIKNTATGETDEIRCQYLAGCDGASSVARNTLDIPLRYITPMDYLETEDHHNLLDTERYGPQLDVEKPRANFMIHWESPDLELFERFGCAWHIQSAQGWTIISQNDKDTWTVHIPLGSIGNWETRDPKGILFEKLGCEFECDIKVANPWYPRLALADSYGKGRVWLAGDSVHQVIPTGGYGMNSGIGDALALGWVLAANVEGWGTPALFDAYETERRHVAARNRIASARHASVRFAIGHNCPSNLLEEGPEADQAREEIGSFIQEAGNLENEAWGIEWGYRYDDSPVICHEEGEPPAYEWEDYVPSTWPGVRPPNVFLEDGTPLFDKFGREFTLLKFEDLDTTDLEDAAAAVGVPLAVVSVEDSNAANLYEKKLVLTRPDQHVAWRGDTAPDTNTATTIINTVRGQI